MPKLVAVGDRHKERRAKSATSWKGAVQRPKTFFCAPSTSTNRERGRRGRQKTGAGHKKGSPPFESWAPNPPFSMASSSSAFFPLSTVGEVRALFKAQLESSDPDLALLSIVAGAIENQWTQAKAANMAMTGADMGETMSQGEVLEKWNG